MALQRWQTRTKEEAYNFNPAYIGALTYEFVKNYESAKSTAPHFTLIFSALPFVLYPDSRRQLPTTRTGLYSWLERTPEALVGYRERARFLVPYIKEGVRYATAREALVFNGGSVGTGPRKASFTPASMNTVTPDVRDTVKSVRMVGKWFAAAGEPQTIMTSLGIRP